MDKLGTFGRVMLVYQHCLSRELQKPAFSFACQVSRACPDVSRDVKLALQQTAS